MKKTPVCILTLLFCVSFAFRGISISWNFPSSKKQEKQLIADGEASFYADKFNGRKTASGDIFKNNKLTAAHKTLPFGTRVKVTNVKNNLCVIVKINDRLPKSSTRIIDLSQRAARQLDLIRDGIVPVKLEVVE